MKQRRNQGIRLGRERTLKETASIPESGYEKHHGDGQIGACTGKSTNSMLNLQDQAFHTSKIHQIKNRN